jgi:hypothetical protein
MQILLNESLPVRLAGALLGQQLHSTRFGLAVVVLVAPTNNVKDLLPLVPAVVEALSALNAGDIVEIGSKGRLRPSSKHTPVRLARSDRTSRTRPAYSSAYVAARCSR